MQARNPHAGAGRSCTVRHTAFLLLAGLTLALSLSGPAAAQSASERQAPVNPYAVFVTEAAQRFGIPEAWIRAIMHVESRGNIQAISPKGAIGLMQIMPATWAEMRARYRLGNDPYDARDNILAGAAYLREMHDRYGSPAFLAAYNAGPGRYEDYRVRGRPLPAETRAYVAMLSPIIEGRAVAPIVVVDAAGPLAWTLAPLFVTQPIANTTAVGAPTESAPAAPSPQSQARDPKPTPRQADSLFVSRTASLEQR